VSLARRIHISAAMQRTYVRAIQAEEPRDRTSTAVISDLLQITRLGSEFSHLTGHTKTMYRDHLLIGHTWLLLGNRSVAVKFIDRSLELYPYDPNAMLLMARATADPHAADEWQAAARHLLEETSTGFSRPYPPTPSSSPP